MATLEEQLAALASGKTEPRKPFSMTDYEAIPLENRQDYVKKTSIPAKPQVSEVLNVSGNIAPKPPVSTSLPKLKQIFNPQPQVQEAAPQQAVQEQAAPQQAAPQMAATSDLVDMDRIREQAASMMPEQGMGDWLTTLAPLATEALFGGGKAGGVSYGIAGKAATDKVAADLKRQQTLEDKLMEIQKARAIAGAKGDKPIKGLFQTKPLFDKATGNTFYSNYDTSKGQYSYPDGSPISAKDLRVGFSVVPEEFDRRTGKTLDAAKEKIDYTPRMNPETMMPERSGKFASDPSVFPQMGALNPKEEKDLKQVTDKFLSSDIYKKATGTLTSVAGVDDLLVQANSGNAAAANFARKELAKMAEGAGRLSDMDVEMVSGSPSIKSKIKRFANLQRTGVPLTKEDILELKEVARILEADARRKLGAGIAGMEQDYMKNLGGPKGAIGKKMEAFVPVKRKQAEAKKPTFEEWKKAKGIK